MRFIGKTHFKEGDWAGVELDEGFIGLNDGMVKGKRYFQTAPKGGVMVRLASIYPNAIFRVREVGTLDFGILYSNLR